MITMHPCSTETIEIELDIINSNPEYNLLANDKEQLTYDDIVQEHKEGKELPTERYLLKDNDVYVGLLDFLMCNPSDQKPWLGLLMIHQAHQRRGYAKRAYEAYEQLMRERGVTEIRLGVITSNENALRLWQALGYESYAEKPYKHTKVYCFEKKLV